MSMATVLPFKLKNTEFKFFLLMAAVIAHGSLFPYRFQMIDIETLKSSLFIWGFTGPVDMASNVLLFVPFGFLGVRSMQTPFKPIQYTLVVMLIGLAFAYFLQVLQLYYIGRVPSMHDVIWNFVGALLGAWLGVMERLRFIGGRRGQEIWMTAPMVLAGCWIMSRLVPMVPSLDLGAIKHALKPLLLHPDFSMANIFRHFVSWTIFAHLCSRFLKKPLSSISLGIVIMLVLFAQVIIEKRAVSLPNALGAAIAFFIWGAVLRHYQKRAIIFVVLTMAMLVVNGLKPFQIGAASGFQWVPFYGYIAGSVGIWTIIDFFEKMFLYGSLVWLLEETECKWSVAATVATLWVLMIEILQIWFVGRSPEITDPFIVLMMAIWVKQFRHVKIAADKPVCYGVDKRRCD